MPGLKRSWVSSAQRFAKRYRPALSFAARWGARRIAKRVTYKARPRAASFRRRGRRAAALGYWGSRQTVSKPRRGRKKVELKRIDIPIGTEAAPIAFEGWGLTTFMFEFQPGQVINAYNAVAGTWSTAAAAPTQGTGPAQRVGDRIYVKQNQMRLCMEKGDSQNEALCCRVVVLQVNDDTADKAGSSFVLGDFFQSNNITSFYKRDCKWKYKVLMDKTLTIGNIDDAFKDRRMTFNFPMGTAKFDGGVATNSLMTGPGDRILYGFFTEPGVSKGTSYATNERPVMHGDYKFTYTDQ